MNAAFILVLGLAAASCDEINAYRAVFADLYDIAGNIAQTFGDPAGCSSVTNNPFLVKDCEDFVASIPESYSARARDTLHREMNSFYMTSCLQPTCFHRPNVDFSNCTQLPDVTRFQFDIKNSYLKQKNILLAERKCRQTFEYFKTTCNIVAPAKESCATSASRLHVACQNRIYYSSFHPCLGACTPEMCCSMPILATATINNPETTKHPAKPAPTGSSGIGGGGKTNPETTKLPAKLAPTASSGIGGGVIASIVFGVVFAMMLGYFLYTSLLRPAKCPAVHTDTTPCMTEFSLDQGMRAGKHKQTRSVGSKRYHPNPNCDSRHFQNPNPNPNPISFEQL